jgi:hypothetical protein
MDGVIQDGKKVVTEQLQAIQTARLAQLAPTVSAAQDAFNTDPSAVNLTNAINGANVMDATARAELPKLYETLAEAHAKLTQAINDPKTSSTAVLTALSAFLQQAQNVKDIADQLSTARK